MGNRRNFIKTVAAASVYPVMGAASYRAFNNNEEPDLSHKFKISLNVYSFNSLLRDHKIDLFDVIDFCARYNFDAIDPTGYYFPGYPEKPSGEFINKFKRKAFLLGLDISGTGIRNDFANPDPETRKADIRLIKEWIEVAADLGTPNLRIFSGNNKHTGYSRDQVFEWMAADIRECCEYGEKSGVIIALQNHDDFIKTSDDVDRIFRMVDSEWLGLNLDIGSYRQDDPYKEIEKNINYAVTWQIKENVWTKGREVPTDFVKLFKLIKNAGYRGYLPLETLGAGDPFIKVPVLLKNVQKSLRRT